MQLEALKIFCDVVRYASVSRGAVENGISQSSASQAVQNLEERLGVKLIDRSKRPLIPTPHGRLYYEECKDLITRYFEIENKVKALGKAETVTGVVRVATIYSVGLPHLKRHMQRFRKLYPGAEVRLECLHPNRVVESLRDETAELGIVSFPRKWSDLTVLPWRDEEMVVAVPVGHALASYESIDVSQLDGLSLVHFDPDLAIRRAIDRFLRRHGVHVESILEFDNIENIKSAVEDGTGLAILPAPALTRAVSIGSLVAVRFREQRLTRPLAIIHRGEGSLSLASARFLELLNGSEDPALSGNSAPGSKVKGGQAVTIAPSS